MLVNSSRRVSLKRSWVLLLAFLVACTGAWYLGTFSPSSCRHAYLLQLASQPGAAAPPVLAPAAAVHAREAAVPATSTAIPKATAATKAAELPSMGGQYPWCQASSGAPYRFPKLIHQTVKDKGRIACEVLDNMASWRDKNPGYEYRLYDDKDSERFIAENYPWLLELFRSLDSPVERADLWRYLILHRYGGVYADSDVKCMTPVDQWNSVNNHDARMLLGIEFLHDNSRKVKQVINFVLASMPCHPLLDVVVRGIVTGIAAAALQGKPIRGDVTIVERTGPVALTNALHDYAMAMGIKWPIELGEEEMQIRGALAGQVRLMPAGVLGMGWETVADHISCEDAFNRTPHAYICHMYVGSWKQNYVYAKPLQYRDDCKFWGNS